MLRYTDEELIALAREQVDPANQYLNELFRRYQRQVGLWCLRYAGERELAADWAQEVFLRAQRGLKEFNGRSKFSTWLYTICRNHCFNQRRATREEWSDPDDLAYLVDSKSPDPEASLQHRQRLEQARQWLAELDETERQVFTLHFSEEMPLDAITRMLDLQNASGAKAFVVSAKRKLKESVRRWRQQHE